MGYFFGYWFCNLYPSKDLKSQETGFIDKLYSAGQNVSSCNSPLVTLIVDVTQVPSYTGIDRTIFHFEIISLTANFNFRCTR